MPSPGHINNKGIRKDAFVVYTLKYCYSASCTNFVKSHPATFQVNFRSFQYDDPACY